MEFLRSLNLESKLSPKKNVEIIWFYIFLPCVIAYFMILSDTINSKPPIGSIESFAATFSSIVNENSKIEVISSDLQWAEGPLWIQDDQASTSFLLFSDTKLNKIFKWEEGKGFFTVGRTMYMSKSGCKNDVEYCNSINEPGSNGLLRKSSDSLDLLVCQHGERAITLITDNGTRTQIATHHKGRRLNSPNDLVWSADGHLYFTDPAFGIINKNNKFVGKELPYSGIYMIKAQHVEEAIRLKTNTSNVVLLDKSFDWPNGLAFSPDFSKLYVSNSNKNNAYWKVFDVMEDGQLSNGRVFYNITDHYACVDNSKTCDNRLMGAPDGLKVDINGYVYATGPGGVWVFNPDAQLVGKFVLNKRVSNVAFGGDGRLYFTAEDLVARVWIKSKPNRVITKTKSFL